MSFIQQELSMIISSDPLNGATNISPDGSSFTVNLQDGFYIRNYAVNVILSVKLVVFGG